MSTSILCLLFLALPCVAQEFDPVAEAKRLFAQYRPTIEKSLPEYDVNDPIVFSGDINGDGKTDVILQFALSAKGANGVVMMQAAIYLNKGISMKVVAAFEPDYCAVIKTINKGLVYVDEYSSCLAMAGEKPLRQHILRYQRGRLVEYTSRPKK